MDGRAAQRAREQIAELAKRGLPLPTFWQAAAAPLARVVPHHMTPCWHTLDPDSLPVTSHFQTELPELPGEWLAHEYHADDAHRFVDVARSSSGVSTLHDATEGRPEGSPGWVRFIEPFGGDQELLLALRSRSGEVWGLVGLYREPGQTLFSAEERRFLCDIAPLLAEGARRGLLFGEATDPEGADAPGLVTLRDDWSVESVTPGAECWLADLPDSRWQSRGEAPPAVLAVAGRARRAADGEAAVEEATVRVLSGGGRSLVLHGAVLASDGGRRVAVIIELAMPSRIAGLPMPPAG